MAVAGIILAGSAIWDAYQKHKANQKAEEQLTAANTKSTQIAADTQAHNTAALKPYTTLGAGAANLLGQGLGIDMGAVSLGGGAPATKAPEPLPVISDLTRVNKADAAKYAKAGAPIPGLDEARAAGAASAPSQRASGYSGANRIDGGESKVQMAPPPSVMLLDPQGNQGEVPAQELPRYLAAGYQQVNA